MRKFILQVAEGIQEVIEVETLDDAKREYQKILAKSEKIVLQKPKIISSTENPPQRKGLYEHLVELKQEDFFANPRTLGEIKLKLEEKTLHYPTTTFPPYLNRLIREKILRRFKKNTDGKEAWVYVNY